MNSRDVNLESFLSMVKPPTVEDAINVRCDECGNEHPTAYRFTSGGIPDDHGDTYYCCMDCGAQWYVEGVEEGSEELDLQQRANP